MPAPAPIYRSQGNALFRTDKQNKSYARGQEAPYGTNGAPPPTGQAAAQADSTAPDVATLVADFNALLAKLRAAGLMAP